MHPPQVDVIKAVAQKIPLSSAIPKSELPIKVDILPLHEFYSEVTRRWVCTIKVVMHVNLDITEQPSGCDCSSSPFVYGPLSHIITRDLSHITNRKLRWIIRKGPNFREQNNVDWDLCLKLCLKGVCKYVR